jgi:putative peptide zinc metalloprotease protein
LISMAGTYVDLLIWIVAVVVWRVTARDTAINYMSWIIVTTCGFRVFFNINPLMRLDGYYALADLLEVHNLRRRSREHWLGYVRWILWGAKRPAPNPDGRALLWYGGISWSFKLTVLYAIFLHLASWLGSLLGPAGMIGGAAVFVTIAKKYFKGSLGGEFTEMFQKRRRLALLWISLAVAVFFLPIYDRSGGPFRVRPVVRWELRAPVAGFLREVAADEGDSVESDAVLARLEVPELASQITRKDAEIHECEANLRRLEAGPRREELAEQRERVKRAETWRDLARRDLERTRQALAEELAGFELRIGQARSEREYLNTFVQQAEQLYRQGGLAGQQLLSEKKRLQVAEGAMQQAEAGKRAREAEGTLTFEGELARREKELADTRAALALLEAGSRSEDIEAERARLQRLREEANHLHTQQRLESVTTPVAGTITTPRLREKVGQFLEKGAVICVVENLEDLEAEIAVSEQDASYVVPGQTVSLKPRSLPFSKLLAKVDRIAPSAAGAEKASEAEKAAQNTVTVYCHLVNADGSLRTGMTGFGRIYHRLRPLGFIVLNRALRLFRTEFWW